MAHEILVTSEEFNKLKNPYTGLPLRTMMVVFRDSEPMFHAAPTEYATADRFDTPAECYRNWSRDSGVEGIRSNDVIRCAYTGEPLSLVRTPDGKCYYTGGFNPKMFYRRDEYLHRASMRNGISAYPKPGDRKRVTKPKPVPGAKSDRAKKAKEARDAAASRLADDAITAAAGSMQAHKDDFEQRASIHVSKK